MTIEFGDLYDFDNNETFEIDILLNSKKEISSKGRNNYNIEKLNYSAHGIVTIVLDKNTINDEISTWFQFKQFIVLFKIN